ncbi:MAG TPA: hypothetical protein DIT05_09440 [Morganella sp. (in: Bacteria)]|nr:hypothetical protein [Morganella sp. (in: enterobacteria)]
MQTEPTITTSNMSVDDVAVWIIEKAKDINHLQSLRANREGAVSDHERKLDRFDEDIADYEARCALTVKTQ